MHMNNIVDIQITFSSPNYFTLDLSMHDYEIHLFKSKFGYTIDNKCCL